MSQAKIAVRNYRPADFHRYVLLQAEVEEAEPTGRCVSPQFIAEQLRRPNYCPEKDLVVAEMGDVIVGYMDIEAELAIRRVILDCAVLATYRRRGLATKLFNHAINRIKKLGVKAVHVNIRQDSAVAVKTLTKLGFSLIRQFLELRLDVDRIDDLDIHPAIEWRYLQPGQEDELTKLQNLAFADAWGYNANTVEAITFRINQSSCSRRDIVLAYDQGRAVGCCWTGISCEKGMPSVRKGRIHMLGVAPNYRGKGIGRELMIIGLTRLRERGLKVAELTVDSENEAACALYESLGFEVQARTLWYEKPVDQS
jgi:mycothiol synthase